jgi:hypothetical protein
MKTESLGDGAGMPDAPKTYFFDGISFQVFSRDLETINLVGKQHSRNVVSLNIHRPKKSFFVYRAPDCRLSVEHIYAIERLLQSYALTFNFSTFQILLPLFGTNCVRNQVEYGGELEIFPPFGS